VSDCIDQLWGGFVQLNSFSSSMKGKDGFASFRYGSAFARVTNNSTRFDGQALAFLHDLASGEHYETLMGLESNVKQTLSWTDMNGLGPQQISVSPYENYTANNADQLGSWPLGAFASTQIHELGNSIAALSRRDIGKADDPSGDSDSGRQLENCVAGKVSGGK
jgi:hypothetical protein